MTDDPYQTNARPQVRNLIGVFILIFGIGLYAFIAAAIGDWIEEAGLNKWLQIIYYALAGLLWLFPAKRLINWIGKNQQDS